MLEELDRIDWASLTHAYGPATDVPEQIRSLLSTSEKVRRAAFWELFGNIHHQGTVYPASAAALPFLLKLLESHVTPDSSELACLIASIAGGSGFLEVHALDHADYFRKVMREEGKSLDEEMEREAAHVAAVRTVVSPWLPLLIPYLSDRDPEVRLMVAYALGKYPEHASLSLPAIEAAIQQEQNGEVIEALVEASKQLSG